MTDCGNIGFSGLWCVDDKCAQDTVAALGETCDFPVGSIICAGFFSGMAGCEIDFGAPEQPGTCVASPGVGEACVNDCIDSFCSSDDVCTAYRAAGEACESGECQEDHYCAFDGGETGTCTSDTEPVEETICTE